MVNASGFCGFVPREIELVQLGQPRFLKVPLSISAMFPERATDSTLSRQLRGHDDDGSMLSAMTMAMMLGMAQLRWRNDVIDGLVKTVTTIFDGEC